MTSFIYPASSMDGHSIVAPSAPEALIRCERPARKLFNRDLLFTAAKALLQLLYMRLSNLA